MTTQSKQLKEEIENIIGEDAYNEGAFMFDDNKMRFCFTPEELSKKVNLLLSKVKEARLGLLEEVVGYTQHDWRCVLSRYSAGRPTKNGGYENKIDGKWYQSRPIDKTPKCTCGLGDILAELKK
jgi:hypothetical protein